MPSEGPRDPSIPTSRGRRRPELLETVPDNEPLEPIDMDPEGLIGAPDEQNPEELPLLYPGDIVMARASVSMNVGGAESWISYGAQTRVQPHENEEDTFYRIGAVVNSRVIELGEAMEVEIKLLQQKQKEAEARRPIVARRR